MKLKPLGDRVLVKRLEEETVTKGGIIIPDTAKEKPMKGEIVAVGDGKLGEDGKRVKPNVKAGEMVLFNKYAGTEVKVEDVEYLIMREDDILCIIEK
ncbi:co-chaperone GroES [Desulfolutivibrio sulfoxidireducens]|uniref:co-chaperone GroES n=1 Tax=Desulfolutivibrio sulfoxidireducens TaxID=2773299 RepID=UPI00159D82B7|nr:co-chaperone GroES [Desulfolutivibrio sulfoxidireducens]QLA18462.1 co-chaperone GroES [Desulfolutivibrio sulfoxidireducens]